MAPGLKERAVRGDQTCKGEQLGVGRPAEEGTKQQGKYLQRKTGRERTDGGRRATRAEMLMLGQTPAILSLRF